MDAVLTLATIPAILALVELAKRVGLRASWATLLAVVLGVVLQCLDYGFLTVGHSPQGWYGAIATGLMLGLSAAGLYDTAKITASKPIDASKVKLDSSAIVLGAGLDGVTTYAQTHPDTDPTGKLTDN